MGTSATWTRTLCPYCGVGCGILAGRSDGKLLKVKGDPAHPSNGGDICPKAIHLPRILDTPDRLRHPMARGRRDDQPEPVTWNAACGRVATAIRDVVRRHGPDAVAMYGSGQLLTEDYYVANKLLKGFIGTNNFDSNSRLCMASAVAGYSSAFGSDGPPVTYGDLDRADLFLIIGSNMAFCHPVLFRRIEARKKAAPDAVRVIVVDPRRTTTADIADLHIPIRPGTDTVFLNAILHVIVREGLSDENFIAQHTDGWAETAALLPRFTPGFAEEACGIKAALIEHLAHDFAAARGAISLWSMGVNQSVEGVRKNHAIINLHLATAQIARPGAGPFSLTGQPNAMGGRETGGLAHLLPGYRLVTSEAHRSEVAALWNVPVGHISSRPGYPALELFEAAADGRVKVLWIVATNPAVSMPDPDLVERAFRQVDLLIVQDAYHPTDTTRFADILLPAAQWAEKEGTMTNSERVVTHLPRLLPAPGEALADWEIFVRVARALGFTEAFPYAGAEDVFEEYKRCTAARPCDVSGMSYGRLQEGPLRWPCPASGPASDAPLYPDARFATPSGRARFHPVPCDGPQERPDATWPLVLTTGRLKNHWHTMTRTRHVPTFQRMEPEPIVEINRQDAATRDIRDGDFVQVTGRRGKLIAQARVTEEIPVGICFAPFHWGRQAGFYKAANNLTQSACDPISKQPELKYAAVDIRRLGGPDDGAGTEAART